VHFEAGSVRVRSQCIKSLKKLNHLRIQLFPFCFHRMPKHCYKSKYLNLRLSIFITNYKLQMYLQIQMPITNPSVLELLKHLKDFKWKK